MFLVFLHLSRKEAKLKEQETRWDALVQKVENLERENVWEVVLGENNR